MAIIIDIKLSKNWEFSSCIDGPQSNREKLITAIMKKGNKLQEFSSNRSDVTYKFCLANYSPRNTQKRSGKHVFWWQPISWQTRMKYEEIINPWNTKTPTCYFFFIFPSCNVLMSSSMLLSSLQCNFFK